MSSKTFLVTKRMARRALEVWQDLTLQERFGVLILYGLAEKDDLIRIIQAPDNRGGSVPGSGRKPGNNTKGK